MKKTLVLLFFMLFTGSMGFAQLTPKEKSKVDKTSIETEVKTTDTCTSTSTTSTAVLTPKKKVVKVVAEEKIVLSDPQKESINPVAKNIYPFSQVEAYLGYVSYSDYLLKGSGWNGRLTVRQSQNLSSLNPRKSMWGMGLAYGRYQTESRQFETDSETFNTTTTEIGGFISVARATKRANWNSLVMNFEGKQSTDEGVQGLYNRKQVDILFVFSGWLDLSRKRDNLLFSRTNFSWYYQYPLKTSVSSFYDGIRVSDNTWNKKLLILNLDQTMLQFNVSEAIDRFSLNIGFNLGYRHYSQNKRDLYAIGIFTEGFYSLSKIVRVGAQLIIDPKGNTSRGKNIVYSLDWDLFQLGRAIF